MSKLNIKVLDVILAIAVCVMFTVFMVKFTKAPNRETLELFADQWRCTHGYSEPHIEDHGFLHASETTVNVFVCDQYSRVKTP